MKETTLNGKTPDIAEGNIQKLRQIFPDVFTENKVDFEKLQQVLGNYVEDSSERYNFTWNGKGRALRLSQTPSLGTLRPCKEESKDWDTTQNLYIEGDNLEVLKLLQKSYHSKVKMIYIDPPYNTGKDFVYPDDFHDNLENYKKLTGQVDSEGNRISTNTEASGRYHTDWLNMMYPRLRLARNLLSDDGVIFISIDDNEVDNLKKICNEVFGEDNFIGCVTRVAKTTSFRGNYLAPSKDYLVCFSKFMENLKPFIDEVDNVSQFNKVEEYGVRKGEKYRDDIAFYLSTLETRPNQRYFIECHFHQKNRFLAMVFGGGVWIIITKRRI
jgi:adenine-specific DNA-methyltransferase